MSEHSFVLPTETGPEDIRVCDGCSLGNPNEERFISPMHTFVIGLDQIREPREDRVGFPMVRLSLKSRRDVTLELAGGTQQYKDVVLPANCDALRDTELTLEAWQRIRETGCSGPEPGYRQYVLLGPRKVGCGLLRLLQSQSLER
jgi:hypothetical protein